MLIDTLKFKTRLIEGGFEENEAQALVDAMAEASTEYFATKTDIQEVRTDIEKLRGETKADFSNLRGELKTDISNLRGELKADIQVLRTEMANMRGQSANTKWMVTTLLVVNLGILGKLLFT